MKNNMIKETKSELKKVIWPTKKTVINGTVVVAVMVVLVGAIILGFDVVSSALITKIIGDEQILTTEEGINVDENVTDPVEENAQTPADENSEPTIDNNEVTE